MRASADLNDQTRSTWPSLDTRDGSDAALALRASMAFAWVLKLLELPPMKATALIGQLHCIEGI